MEKSHDQGLLKNCGMLAKDRPTAFFIVLYGALEESVEESRIVRASQSWRV